MLAARVSEYSLRSRSKNPDNFDVRFLRLETTPYLYRLEGQRFRWAGRVCVWRNVDLQSFAPLRLKVPEEMGFEGRALLIDPDVFAVDDINDLLTRDMHGKAILSRRRPDRLYSTAVMLLDCARLRHWRWKETIDAVFAMKVDLYQLYGLAYEDADTIGLYEDEWNHLDTLNEHTKLLHTTERLTQPWKTGLPIDFDLTIVGSYPYQAGVRVSLQTLLKQRLAWWTAAQIRTYKPHPDPKQESYFYALLGEAIEQGAISEAFVAEEIRRKHVRPDSLELVGKARRARA